MIRVLVSTSLHDDNHRSQDIRYSSAFWAEGDTLHRRVIVVVLWKVDVRILQECTKVDSEQKTVDTVFIQLCP